MKKAERPQYITQLNAFHRWLCTNYLPPNAKLLWFMLIGLFNAAGWPEYVQIGTLHLMHLVSTQTDKAAFRARQSLVDAGLLLYERGRKNQPGRYRLVWFTDGIGMQNGTGNVRKNDGNTTEKTTEKTSDEHTLYIREDKEEEKDETKQKDACAPAELGDAWSAYAEMRQKMRKPLTDAAKQFVLRALESFAPGDPDAQRQILEQSILNGWAGVYPLKTKEAPEPPASYDIGEFERRLLYGKIEYKKTRSSRKTVQHGEID